MKKIFGDFDLDGDGRVDKREFHDAMVILFLIENSCVFLVICVKESFYLNQQR